MLSSYEANQAERNSSTLTQKTYSKDQKVPQETPH